jgi:spermidine synthase
MLSSRNIKLIIYTLFFGSGFSGLVYEVVWVRMLHTILGSTTYAVSIVLTAFMAGLAIGSFLAGRWIEKKADALKIYAWIEIGIGFFAFLSPVSLNALNSLYVWMHNQMSLSFQMVNIFRFILSFAVLIVPTALMGATLPVLSKFFVRTESGLGKDIGGLYGFNTLGAMTGCFFTGFFLVQAMGIRQTIFLAALINILVAITIFILHKRFSSTWTPIAENQLAKSKPRERKQKSQKTYPKSLLHIVLLIFAVSGFFCWQPQLRLQHYVDHLPFGVSSGQYHCHEILRWDKRPGDRIRHS